MMNYHQSENKQCLICRQYNIVKKKYKNILNYCYCSDCYIGNNKIRCLNCRQIIELEFRWGKIKTRCFICSLSKSVLV